MPSPLAHALAGFAVGWLVHPRPRSLDRPDTTPPLLPDRGSSRLPAYGWRWPVLLAGVGMAADLDLLAGCHSAYTHSVGAALLVLCVALVLTRRSTLRQSSLAASLALAAAWLSHVLLDWLAEDFKPPIGIMALWPFNTGYYQAPVQLFMGVSRRIWTAEAWRQDMLAVAREMLVMVPVALAAWWVRRPRRGMHA